MPIELTTVITTSVALILGWLLSEASNWFRTRRDEAYRKLARREAKDDQRADFQRQTLIEIQEKLLQLNRSTFQIYFADLMAQNQGGRWGSNLVPDEIAEMDRELTMRLAALTVRVADDGLREQISGYIQICKEVGSAKSQDEAHQAEMEMERLFGSVNIHLGEILRSTY